MHKNSNRIMTIRFGDKTGQINLDTVDKIIIEPKLKSEYGDIEVIFFNEDKTRAADFTLDSMVGALEFANHVLNRMIGSGAKYFKGQ